MTKRIDFWFSPAEQRLYFRDGRVYTVSVGAAFEHFVGKEPGEKLEFVLADDPKATATPTERT